MRLDVYLVKEGYFQTRQKAVFAIQEGIVEVGGKVITKNSYTVENEDIKILGEGLRYVSRGGLKLLSAIDTFHLDIKNKRCLDLGASTGGFTQCLLEHGAKSVIALDVGTMQLHESLRTDRRVTVLEKCNARNLSQELVKEPLDIVTSDLSFISQKLIYKPVSSVLKEEGIFVSLIKPQFEAGPAFLNKKGIVTDFKIHEKVIFSLKESASSDGLYLNRLSKSPILGGDGNTEYLALFSRNMNHIVDDSEIKQIVYS